MCVREYNIRETGVKGKGSEAGEEGQYFMIVDPGEEMENN